MTILNNVLSKGEIFHSFPVVWVEPEMLLHPGRLDIAVKYLFACDLLNFPTQNSGVSAKEIYLRHILFRTGGKEPGDENRKGTLQDFLTHFITLLQSMKLHGFDANYPIPIAKRTGLILNGAHRLASALALGIKKVPVVYVEDVEGLRWDADWFIKQGFLPIEIDEIVRTWIELRGDKAACVILWPTVASYWLEIIQEIAHVTPLAYQFDIELPSGIFAELIRDIYAADWGPIPGENIERKIQFFKSFPPRAKVLIVATQHSEEIKSIKAMLRERYHSIVPTDAFATLHTSDSVYETSYLANILLNRFNLAALHHRPPEGFRAEFLQWLAQYHLVLQKLSLDKNMCCVVGSGVLEALNIRNATDIDFTLTHTLREKYFTPGVTHLIPDLDVVCRDYPRALLRASADTDNDLIRDRKLHTYMRGLKFAALDIVLTRKQTQRRPKDLVDIELASRLRLQGKINF